MVRAFFLHFYIFLVRTPWRHGSPLVKVIYRTFNNQAFNHIIITTLNQTQWVQGETNCHLENHAVPQSQLPVVFQAYKALIMRIREPRTTAVIYQSGNMVCTGAKRSVCLVVVLKDSFHDSVRTPPLSPLWVCAVRSSHGWRPGSTPA